MIVWGRGARNLLSLRNPSSDLLNRTRHFGKIGLVPGTEPAARASRVRADHRELMSHSGGYIRLPHPGRFFRNLSASAQRPGSYCEAQHGSHGRLLLLSIVSPNEPFPLNILPFAKFFA